MYYKPGLRVQIGFYVSNDHIPTEEIEKDIADTIHEIETMKREVEALRVLGDRMSHFRADSRVNGIEERKVFVEKLRRILETRLTK